MSRAVVAAVSTLLLTIAAPAADALVLPPEGIELTQIHVQLEWPAVAGATSYDLQVVEDDGSPDPFATAPLLVDQSIGAGSPRAVVTSGLSFGQSLAWRVRGVLGAPLAWSSTHRFDIADVPAGFPSYTVTVFGGPLQPGLTLFGARLNQQPNLNMMAIDGAGELVWFHVGVGLDPRLLDNGRLLVVGGNEGFEMTLNGQRAWQTPINDGEQLHHEISPMPNGDYLSLSREYVPVELAGETKDWQGDVAVVFDRDTNGIVWSWSVFDSFSTDDFDQTVYDASGSTFDWSHANAAIYNPDDDSVYLSFRHLSRVTRIDFATGDIVYNMGFDMPSGEVDFGDNLFSFQHALEMQPNGNLLLYDNGNRRDHIVHTPSTGVTKAVELSFAGDPPTGASIVWSWTLPSYNSRWGDADRLANGNTLVSSGVQGIIHEVSAAGVEVRRIEITGGGTWSIYRARQVDALVLDLPGDADGDGLADLVDNCPDHPNAAQLDCDLDGFGDVCAEALRISFCEPPNVIPALPPVGLAVLALGLVAAAGSMLEARRAALQR